MGWKLGDEWISLRDGYLRFSHISLEGQTCVRLLYFCVSRPTLLATQQANRIWFGFRWFCPHCLSGPICFRGRLFLLLRARSQRRRRGLHGSLAEGPPVPLPGVSCVTFSACFVTLNRFLAEKKGAVGRMFAQNDMMPRFALRVMHARVFGVGDQASPSRCHFKFDL